MGPVQMRIARAEFSSQSDSAAHSDRKHQNSNTNTTWQIFDASVVSHDNRSVM